ncbi:hypothetical protein CERZMDRAFT_48479 [Cercospora zeae-maydis SCOH1-5]|uniref:F-box domain-containing protein n=1 Tax=Cercospora zeae-maydis SCOH1-5 TaxID=717836 RepID=A0A6A6F5V7_9PEZI|nr:hypothetical protein CERZMDRAFT_48479 [Cercospora zeae-maydis SCOH1-5]
MAEPLQDDSIVQCTRTNSLTTLPDELLLHVLSFLAPLDLAQAAQTCRRLAVTSYDDILWSPIVNKAAAEVVPKPTPMRTFRDLYVSLHPYWFLATNRIWFGDTEPTGKLILARYDASVGAIVAHQVVAVVARSMDQVSFWEKDRDVFIHSFNPRVGLDMNQPVLKLDIASTREQSSVSDTPMETFSESGLHSTLMLCRALPAEAISEATAVWPPLRIPAAVRARNASSDGFRSTGHVPERFSEVSQNNFRLKKWAEYHGRASSSFGAASRIAAALGIGLPYAMHHLEQDSMEVGAGPNVITTYSSLVPHCFTSTSEKPWQGIFVGDYSTHGCEFLLVTQPDEQHARPLPSGMDWLREWFLSNAFPHVRSQDYDDVPSGRLEAIKLTGDPNVPRSQYSFVAPDIGHGGFLRVADENLFRGARVVRAAGHVASRGFQEDHYIPSQLIMISHDRLAQFW